LNIYNKKVQSEYDNLKTISTKNEIMHSKIIELVKKRASLLKNIMKLRENIGLLENPFILKKMEFDLKKISVLKNRAINIESKLYQDRNIIYKISRNN
jgi:hypothetical protein